MDGHYGHVDDAVKGGDEMIKGAKSIAEYKILEYLDKKKIDVEYFVFKMIGPQEAVIKDVNGDQMRLIYNPATRMVIEMDLEREEEDHGKE